MVYFITSQIGRVLIKKKKKVVDKFHFMNFIKIILQS